MQSMRTHSALATALVLALTACGGSGEKADTAASSPPAAQAPAATAGENVAPDAGGKVIVIQALTDDQGNNKFDPAEIEAHPGDVLRFTLKSGVHNVDFLADSNTVKTGLPAVTPFLQLPGQTYDIKVTMAPGKYYFQCDPHAALGMKGHLEVEAK
jgi:plastocyanin